MYSKINFDNLFTDRGNFNKILQFPSCEETLSLSTSNFQISHPTSKLDAN